MRRAARVVGTSLLMVLVLAGAGGARAQVAGAAGRRPQAAVVETVAATGDVHDVVALDGDRVAAATSGGLVLIEAGRVARVLGTSDGLPGARLRSIDAIDGALWAGGIEGLAEVRLDAGDARVARTFEVPRVRRATRFAGAVWVATYGGGVLRLRDGAAAFEVVALGGDATTRRATDLLVVGEELWVATAGRGVLRLAPGGAVVGRIRRTQGLADDVVWDLEGDGGDVLAATLGGLSRVDASGVVDRRDAAGRAAARLAVRDVRAVRADGDHLLVASWGGGAAEIRGGRLRAIGGADATRSRALAIADDVVWIAGEHGLSTWRSGGAVRVLGGGLPSADVTSLARARGAIWIGTFDRGLARMDARGRVEPVSIATARWSVDPRVNDLAVTRDERGERLWIATDRGLFVHDGRIFAPIDDRDGPGPGHVTSLHVDPEGALWATTSRVLARLRGGRWQRWQGGPELPIAQLHAVTTDRRGTIWVGSLHGLLRFDPSSGRFARESVSTGALPVDWVTAVAPWRGGLLAGTYHGGLAIHDGARFRIEREGETLPCGWINPHAITVHEGRAWLGTLEGGLLVGEPGAWARVSRADGLPSDDVTDVLPIGALEAWVATRAGLARVRLGGARP